MPTLILLDTSLSMERSTAPPLPSLGVSDVDFAEFRTAHENGDSSSLTLLDLAKLGVSELLDHLELHYRLEQLSLLSFSSQCELLAPFTRDIASVRARLEEVNACAETTNLISAVRGLLSVVHEHWGSGSRIDVLLVTDGGAGHGPLSLSAVKDGAANQEGLFPFPFKGSMTVVCLFPPSDPLADDSRISYERFLDRTGLDECKLETPKDLSASAIKSFFKDIAERRYRQFVGSLTLGAELKCSVTLCPPPPREFRALKDFEAVEAQFSQELEVRGFLTLADVASPPVLSRHLVLPWTGGAQTEEDSRTPNLCVFLHGAMKIEGMCALTQVSPNWFGILFSCADTKKKSSLMLSLFEPGETPVPWMGNLNHLGPMAGLSQTNQEPFPVRGTSSGIRKPSYSSSPVVWIRPSSLQSDVQKILRHARKLPDKTQHFYKELNRLRRNALCIGFHELLSACAACFDRECAILPGSAHPDCAIQLSHAASELRGSRAKDLDYIIQPVGTKYKRD